MQDYENCPVNEWNESAPGVEFETLWPWGTLVLPNRGEEFELVGGFAANSQGFAVGSASASH